MGTGWSIGAYNSDDYIGTAITDSTADGDVIVSTTGTMHVNADNTWYNVNPGQMIWSTDVHANWGMTHGFKRSKRSESCKQKFVCLTNDEKCVENNAAEL